MKAKKLISLVLCLMMVLSVVSFSASAASSFFFEDFEGYVAPVWETIGNSSIIGSTGAWGDVTVASEASGNKYLFTQVVNGSGNRGMLREFPAYDTKTATVSFDWNPSQISAVPNTAEIRFYSESSTSGFMFGLVWTAAGKIGYHTANLNYGRTSVVGTSSCPSTGLDIGNWYKVTLNFDFEAHTVDLAMVGRDDPSLTFSAEDIAIGTSHKKFATFIWYGVKGSGGGNINATSLMDNFKIDVEEYAANEILSITQPDTQIVAAGDQPTLPTSVQALLGNGTTATIPVGEWTCDPAFDANVYRNYTFTAPLVLGDTYANSRNITASFRVTTSQYYSIERVLDPTTIQIDYVEGQPMPALPTTVTAKLNNGTWVQAPVGQWTATRAFNPNAEGVATYTAYVQGVEGQYTVSSATAFKVTQYILSYSMGDNFNGYTRSMEWLDRGVVALKADDGIFVSWRLLATEYGKNIAFNVYKNNVKLNAEPITTKTNYLDAAGKPGDVYAVETILGGTSTMSESFTALEHNYLAIPIQKPADQPTVNNSMMGTYSANDASCADVDGDGEYEIVVKWYPNNQIDSGSSGMTSPTFFDCYKLDGTVLWRIDMGYNITSGAHYSMFMFYDFDQDGNAEFLIKCADGTTVYAPNKDGIIDMDDESTIIDYVGDPSLDGVNCLTSGSLGHIKGGNEYFAAFDGLTGKVIDVTNYQFPIGNVSSWGDSSYNRSDRYNAGIGYVPNPNSDDPSDIVPAAFMERGYYARTTICAYTLLNDKLQNIWNFDSTTYNGVGGKGNHNTVTGDVDGDGYDEYILGGAITLDHDGTLLWAKDGKNGLDNLAHGDVIHMSKMFPDNERFYIWSAYESTSSVVNSALTDAASGARVFGEKYGNVDAGRGCAANITPNPGFEVWSQRPGNETPNQRPSGSLYNVYGQMIAEVKGINFSCNWRTYWDGDLLSELPDGQYIGAGNGETPQAVYKYNWVTNELEQMEVFADTLTNNGTKNTPNLAADLFGDWREEICSRSTDSSELRIYSTTIPTEYMIYTLMHDPGYRLTVGNQNCCYNQPPHLSFYLGEDIADTVRALELPVADMYYTNDPSDSSGFTAKADKAAYAVDETITVTVTAPSSVEKVYLVNEAGNGLASSRSSVVNGDTTTWTLTLALGTVGERTLGVYADGENTGETVSFEIGYPEATGAPEVTSVMPPLTIKANEAFTVTITTNAFAQNVRLFNENGAGLMPSACSYVEKDGARVWSYTIAVGTAGQRTFTAKAAAEDNVYVGNTLVSLYVG